MNIFKILLEKTFFVFRTCMSFLRSPQSAGFICVGKGAVHLINTLLDQELGSESHRTCQIYFFTKVKFFILISFLFIKSDFFKRKHSKGFINF